MNLSEFQTNGGAVRLDDWRVILADGPEAAGFLHGQLTQNIQTLPADRARLAGYCSAKGRLLASFVVWRLGPERLGLACSADVLPATLKRLSMFVLRARCKLSDAGDQVAVWGLAGAAAAQWLGPEAARAAPWHSGVPAMEAAPDSRWIRLPDAEQTPRWLLMAAAEADAPTLPPLSAATWAWLEVCSGVPRVTAATVDHFVPQMVNLELVGGVDFQKGCYPGQEVVARSQYRGTLKRRMVRMHGTAALTPGDEMHHSSDPGQPAGEVVLAAPAPQGGFEALVEVKLAMLEIPSSENRFSAKGVDWQPGALPYVLAAPA